MKLKIRYENIYQTIEVLADEMWVSLSIDLTPKDEEEKEKIIQEDFDKKFNRPDYNNWHKFNRHLGYIKSPFKKDIEDNDINPIEYISDNSEEERKRADDYENMREKLLLKLKREYAEVIISIILDEKTPEEYAKEIGVSTQAVYKRLQRAKKKYKEILKKCPK